jgi:hypothetical protein
VDLGTEGSILPASLLSPELLAHIMELAAFRKAVFRSSSWMFFALQDWHPDVPDLNQAIILSHVCGFWRRVALDTASIWTAPRLSTYGDHLYVHDFVDSSLLGRAKETGLTIYSSARPNTRRGADAFIRLSDLVLTSRIEPMSRLEHVWVTFGDPVSIPLTEQDAPLLKSLYVSVAKPLDVPKNAPRLRTLVLDEINHRRAQLSTVIECPLFPQLTRLAIGFSIKASLASKDIIDVLNIIERAPSLTDLAIRNVYRAFFWVQWSTERTTLQDKVNLPLLERLTLIGDSIVMQAVLDHVQLPDRLELWLEPAVENSQYPDDPERTLQAEFVAHYLSQPYHIPSKLVVTHMECEGRHGGRNDFVSFQLFYSDGHRPLSLPIRGEYSDAGFFYWIRDVTAALPWDLLTETRLSLGDLLPPDELLKRTLRAGRLTTLHASSSAIARMAEIMRVSMGAGSGDERTVWLPELRKLVAVGVCLEDLKAFLLAWKDVNPHRMFETLILNSTQVDSTAANTLLEQLDVRIVQVLVMSTSRTLHDESLIRQTPRLLVRRITEQLS